MFRRSMWALVVPALLLGGASRAEAQPIVVKMATLVPENSSWHLILKETAAEWHRPTPR